MRTRGNFHEISGVVASALAPHRHRLSEICSAGHKTSIGVNDAVCIYPEFVNCIGHPQVKIAAVCVYNYATVDHAVAINRFDIQGVIGIWSRSADAYSDRVLPRCPEYQSIVLTN